MPSDPPPLSRSRLERVLGVGARASTDELMRAGVRLLTALARRRDRARPDERAALEHEAEELLRSTLHWAGGPGVAPAGRGSGSGSPREGTARRERLLFAALFLLILVVVVMAATRLVGSSPQPVAGESAVLLIESRPPDALLRIRDVESEELLARVPAEGVRIELAAGRFELEVSREDCPDGWTRVVELEAGETRRYEPTLCQGAGELVVRSNVSGDRVQIDSFDVGPTRAEPHVLGVGDHVVRVAKPGYQTFEARVRIRPDERHELRAELVPGAADAGSSPSPPRVAAGRPAPGDSELPPPLERRRPTAPPPTQATSYEPDPPEAATPFDPNVVKPEKIDPARAAGAEKLFDFAKLEGEGRGGGSTTWHANVSKLIVSEFDRNGSGSIDTVAETESIPCELWRRLERDFDRGRLGLSMARLYGFDGSEWHPDALGFAREQRALAYERMIACGLAP